MAGNKAVKVLGLIFLFIGAGLMVIAIICYFDTKSFLANSNEIQGKVIGFVRGYKGVFCPIISFKTEDGKIMKFKESFGTRPPQYKKGDLVRVLYNPKNPSYAKINSFWSLWFVEILFAFLGLVFSLVGAILLIKFRT